MKVATVRAFLLGASFALHCVGFLTLGRLSSIPVFLTGLLFSIAAYAVGPYRASPCDKGPS